MNNKVKKYPRTAACMLWFGQSIMLAQRLKTHTFSGYWESAGGKIEPNETIYAGIKREILEEVGIFVPTWEMELLDCITDDPTTDKCFLFARWTHSMNFLDVIQNKERKKRTRWTLFTPEEALKLQLMPGLRENMVRPQTY